jgi:hypothetical protein
MKNITSLIDTNVLINLLQKERTLTKMIALK